MAKARITTKDGTKITIEGTPDEVARLIGQVGGEPAASAKSRGKAKEGAKTGFKHRTTITDLIGSLIDGGYFRKPKDLAAVKGALEEMGHVYPVTTLSPILLRLVRRRQLRRIKDKNRWLYTG